MRRAVMTMRAMTVCAMTVRAMTVRAMTVRAMTMRAMTVRAMTVRAMTVGAMTMRAMTVRAMTVRAMTVGVVGAVTVGESLEYLSDLRLLLLREVRWQRIDFEEGGHDQDPCHDRDDVEHVHHDVPHDVLTNMKLEIGEWLVELRYLLKFPRVRPCGILRPDLAGSLVGVRVHDHIDQEVPLVPKNRLNAHHRYLLIRQPRVW